MLKKSEKNQKNPEKIKKYQNNFDPLERTKIRQGNYEDLILHIDFFIGIAVPRLGTKLVMNKNGLLFPMCCSMTKHRHKTSLDSR